MFRLIEADRSAAWKLNLRDRPPTSLFNIRALDILLDQSVNLRSEVVAHEVKLMALVLVHRMDGKLRWGEGEDQPIMTGIYRGIAQDITKECSVSGGILAIDNDVGSKDHSRQRLSG
jgi:hypothetical protein